MASKKERLRLRLRQELETAKPTVISESIAAGLLAALFAEEDVASERMWRDLLRELDIPLAPLVEGVRQDDFVSLERTLLGLAQEYAQASTSGDNERKRRCRKLVIEAKDHAKLAARNQKVAGSKRAQKEEMTLWMLTWLENPAIFETWVGLRKPQLTAVRDSPPE